MDASYNVRQTRRCPSGGGGLIPFYNSSIHRKNVFIVIIYRISAYNRSAVYDTNSTDFPLALLHCFVTYRNTMDMSTRSKGTNTNKGRNKHMGDG
eukprot:scaffold421243_cov52-Attheya_sp.AAC.5